MALRKAEIIEWLNTLEGDPLCGIDESGLALRPASQTKPVWNSPYLEIGGLPDYFCPSCNDFVEAEVEKDGRELCMECGHLVNRSGDHYETTEREW